MRASLVGVVNSHYLSVAGAPLIHGGPSGRHASAVGLGRVVCAEVPTPSARVLAWLAAPRAAPRRPKRARNAAGMPRSPSDTAAAVPLLPGLRPGCA